MPIYRKLTDFILLIWLSQEHVLSFCYRQNTLRVFIWRKTQCEICGNWNFLGHRKVEKFIKKEIRILRKLKVQKSRNFIFDGSKVFFEIKIESDEEAKIDAIFFREVLENSPKL